MQKAVRTKSDSRMQSCWTRLTRQRFTWLLLFASSLLFSSGCRRDMQDQPKAKPYRSSSFFKDGLSSRAPVAGTVARGWLHTDTEFFTGKKNKTQGPTNERNAVLPGQNPEAAPVVR